MNIGIMQLGNFNTISAKQSVKAPTNTMNTKGNNFGDVFSNVVSSSTKDNDINNEAAKEGLTDLEELTELLNSDSIEEILDLLGISHDEGLLMVGTDNGQAVAIDELMNLEDLLSVLNIDQEQLLETVQQLLGDDSIEVNNIWDFIQIVNEQASTLIPQITTALQGEHKATPKEVEQLLQFLKLAYSTGKNSDLLNEQAAKLTQLQESLQAVSKQLEANYQGAQSKTVETSSSVKVSLQGFQQVVEQTIKKSETNEPSSTLGTATTTVSTKTVTITLPTEKPAQSEALLKEIQNLLNRSQLSGNQGSMKLLLKLYPENLGSIRIELMQQDGVLTARLLTSTSLGKELLDSQLQQLKAAFAQQNIQIDRIDIAQTLQETDRNMRDQNPFSNLFKQQQSEQEDDNNQTDEEEEKISFSEYLINEGV